MYSCHKSFVSCCSANIRFACYCKDERTEALKGLLTMKINKIAAVALAVIAPSLASQAHATVLVADAPSLILTYDLTDTPLESHPDGGFYKNLGAGLGFDTYSFEENGASVTLRYDSASNTAQIYGKGYSLSGGYLSDFNLTYDEVTLSGSTLSLRDMDAVGTIEGNTIFGKGFDFELLGDSLTGHGWLTNSAGEHFGDFHLAGNRIADAGAGGGDGGGFGGGGGGGGGQVPLPAPLTLIGAAALFGAWRLKRSTQKKAGQSHPKPE